MASLNQIKRPTTLKRSMQRVGRGQSSGRGKQSGRGGKGQTARAGAKIRPAWRDIVKKLPKRRGYGKNRGRTVVSTRPTPLALSLTRLDKIFDSGATVSKKTLIERGLVSRGDRAVKIVGPSTSLGDARDKSQGTSGLTKKLTIQNIPVSASARSLIEKAGGTIQ